MSLCDDTVDSSLFQRPPNFRGLTSVGPPQFSRTAAQTKQKTQHRCATHLLPLNALRHPVLHQINQCMHAGMHACMNCTAYSTYVQYMYCHPTPHPATCLNKLPTGTLLPCNLPIVENRKIFFVSEAAASSGVPFPPLFGMCYALVCFMKPEALCRWSVEQSKSKSKLNYM